ncbi:MAG: DNA polymerase III subunit beta [Calditerrivibrio sp.]|nr:DNA polymerase III subunit beta [Calditerrivibrio sp.]
MKFKLIKQELYYILNNAINFTSSKNTNTILQNIYISAENNTVLFKTNNILSGFCAQIEANVESEGSTTVICKKLLDIVKELPDSSQISFNFDGSRLKITSGQANFTLATMPTEMFPAMTDIVPEYSIKVESKLLYEAINKTIFCVANSSTKIEFTGLHLKVYGNKLELHSADFQRISSIVLNLPEEQSDEFIINIPKKTASDLLKIIGDTLTVELHTDKKQLMVISGNIKVYSRLIDRSVKSINSLFSADTPIEVTLNKTDFLENLKKVMAIASEVTYAVVLSFSSNSLTIYSLETEYGQGIDRIENISHIGDDIDIIVNGKLLQEILNHIDSTNVTIKMSGRRNPIFIYPDTGNYKYLLVPLAIDRG